MSTYDPGDQIIFRYVQSIPPQLIGGVVIREATTAENTAIATSGSAGSGPFLWVFQGGNGGPQVSSGTFPFYSGIYYVGIDNVVAVYKPHSVDQTAISGFLT